MPRTERPAGVLLLDFDGTLADSLQAMRAAYACFMEGFGRQVSDVEFDRLNGPPLPEVVRLLQEAHSLPGRHEELLACYQAVIGEVYGEVRPAVGARELLSAAAARGWTVGVVTSNDRHRVQDWLERHALSALVTFVVAGEDTSRGKPHPDPYLAALAHSGFPRESVIAVEDSPQGVAAALAAGLTTYAYQANPNDKSPWPDGARPLARLEDLTELLAAAPRG